MIDWWCPVIQRQNTVGTNVGYQEQKAINTIYPVFADDTKIYSIIKSVWMLWSFNVKNGPDCKS